MEGRWEMAAYGFGLQVTWENPCALDGEQHFLVARHSRYLKLAIKNQPTNQPSMFWPGTACSRQNLKLHPREPRNWTTAPVRMLQYRCCNQRHTKWVTPVTFGVAQRTSGWLREVLETHSHCGGKPRERGPSMGCAGGLRVGCLRASQERPLAAAAAGRPQAPARYRR